MVRERLVGIRFLDRATIVRVTIQAARRSRSFVPQMTLVSFPPIEIVLLTHDHYHHPSERMIRELRSVSDRGLAAAWSVAQLFGPLLPIRLHI